jgi:hypothetical protein
MSKVRAALGYTVAALCIPLMIYAFVGRLDEAVVEATGLTIAPEFTGGEVVQTVDHGSYQTHIHRQVYDGLIGERKEGFVQVDWAPADALPAHIDQEIDLDQDGQADLHIALDPRTRQAVLTPYAAHVTALQGVYHFEGTVAIRVSLRNPKR